MHGRHHWVRPAPRWLLGLRARVRLGDARRRATARAAPSSTSRRRGDDDALGSAGLGVRRPLRFLSWKLDLTNEQIAAVARILERLKIERAQAEVEQRRSAAAIADALEGESFDSAAASVATDHRADAARAVQKAVAGALAELHAALEPDQRRRLAMLIRTRAISI